MAIVDQKINFQLYNLYRDLQIATDNMQSAASLVKQYIAQIEALGNYQNDSSVEEKLYIGAVKTLMNNIERERPVPPDIIAVNPLILTVRGEE